MTDADLTGAVGVDHQCLSIVMEQDECDCGCHVPRRKTCGLDRDGKPLGRRVPVSPEGDGLCCPLPYAIRCRLYRGHNGDHTDAEGLCWGLNA